MSTFCAGCAGDVTDGAVIRGGWVYCSVECAQTPGHWMSRFLNLSSVLVRPDLELAMARAPVLRRPAAGPLTQPAPALGGTAPV